MLRRPLARALLMRNMEVPGENCMAESNADQTAQAPTDRLEQLADETGWAAEVVQNLYQGEYQLLQRDARVRNFLPVLALKRVRDLLRRYEQTRGAQTRQ